VAVAVHRCGDQPVDGRRRGLVLTQDRPKGDEDGEVARLIIAELGCGDALRQAWAADAMTDLAVIWDHDERVRDSVYAVAETVVRPWQ
jgi:hypothetical protein